MNVDTISRSCHLIPREFIDDLLARIDIVQIIDKRLNLRKAGANYVARCPFHEEKTPSFSVNPQKQFFYCFGCGAHGNAISFLMQFDRMNFLEAIKYLASYLGLDLPNKLMSATAQADIEKSHRSYDLLAKISLFYRYELEKSPKAREYLKSRGLSEEICQRFIIGYAPPTPGALAAALKLGQIGNELLLTNGLLKKNNAGEIYERFRNRIIFPIRDVRGRIIAFGGRALGDDLPKYLNSPETQLFHKGDELYGLFEAKGKGGKFAKILVAEGYMDVVALAQHGIDCAVASMGTSITARQIEKLLRYSATIIFSFDGDKAGQIAAWRALEIMLPLVKDGIDVKFLFLPEMEDPDSYIRKKGRIAFYNCLTAAVSLSDFFFKHLSLQIDLSTFEGRAALAQQASKLLQNIRDGVFRELLWQKLAKLVRIDIEKLRPIDYKSHNYLNADLTSRRSTLKHIPQASEAAIILLLHQPSLVFEIDEIERIKRLNMPYINLFVWLTQLLQHESALSIGAILDRCENADDAKLLAKLATQIPLIPATGLKNEFLGVINMLYDYADEQMIDMLLSKANTAGLSREEKRTLQTLITKNKSKIKL